MEIDEPSWSVSAKSGEKASPALMQSLATPELIREGSIEHLMSHASVCEFNGVIPHYHSDFARPPTSADIILQSKDDILFTFDRATLIAHSSFFNDILSIPDPSNSPIMTLPSATSEALAVILFIIATAPSKYTCAHAQFKIRGDRPLLYVVLHAADAYDIPEVPRQVFQKLYNNLRNEPFLRFAVAAIAGNEYCASEASRLTLTHKIDTLPDEVETLLLICAPKYLALLRKLHANHAAMEQVLLDRLYHRDTSLRKRRRHLPPCKDHTGSSCDILKLRRKAAEAVWAIERSRTSRDAWNLSPLYVIIESVVDCPECCQRFSRSCRWAGTPQDRTYWWRTGI